MFRRGLAALSAARMVALLAALVAAALAMPLCAQTARVAGARLIFAGDLASSQSSAIVAASPGVRAWTFAPELVAALDALFAGHGDAEAAT